MQALKKHGTVVKAKYCPLLVEYATALVIVSNYVDKKKETMKSKIKTSSRSWWDGSYRKWVYCQYSRSLFVVLYHICLLAFIERSHLQHFEIYLCHYRMNQQKSSIIFCWFVCLHRLSCFLHRHSLHWSLLTPSEKTKKNTNLPPNTNLCLVVLNCGAKPAFSRA